MAVKNSILERIIQSKREKLEKQISKDPGLAKIREMAKRAPPGYDFYRALSNNTHLALIAEIKRASPSKGLMRADLDSASQARMYQDLGASALSILTEEDYFHGTIEDLKRARAACTIPILRKDFIVHPYQVYEARAWGADAVLLIAAILSKQDLLELVELTHQLGMDSLVEVHHEEEIPMAIGSETRIIGINNRDLTTFHVDLKTTARLSCHIPKDYLLVSESGIKGIEEARQVCSWGVKAILVGEALVTSSNPDTLIQNLTQVPLVC